VRDESNPGEGESREEERLQGVDRVTANKSKISKYESDDNEDQAYLKATKIW